MEFLGTIPRRVEETRKSFTGGTVLSRLSETSDYSVDSEAGSSGVFAISSSTEYLYENRPRIPKETWGARHTLILMGFLGFAATYGMRVNLSVAIVAMVKHTLVANSSNENSEGTCPMPNNGGDQDSSLEISGEFDWDENVQGLMLAAFFYGYAVSNLFGGRLAEHFGGKLVLGWGIVLTGILSIISPFCARIAPELFFAIRVLEGLTEGVTVPSMHQLLSTWAPSVERSQFSSFVYAGVQFGTVITMPVCGWLCNTDLFGGWPSAFYIFGGLGVIWGVFWYFLVYDLPEDHPKISQEELTYILGWTEGNKQKEPLAVPWREIFTSRPFYALAILHFGNSWGFYTLLTELPTYLSNIQHFDMKSNGLVSALPYLIMWLVSVIYSLVMGLLARRGRISLIGIRRLSASIAAYGPMLALVAMCFVNCDRTLALVVLCLAMGLNGAVYCGYTTSHMDLAPNFAGTLMGLTNSFGTIPGIAAPSVTGAITYGNQTLGAWRTVFLLAAVLYCTTATVYVAFISADVQPWNEGVPARAKKDEGEKTKF
ncbi:putative inorganic phosphate cotransporter [Oratosquilla oratoria]|uniref:putative inorganic phosphate cotransporter n=1 Tax=Oratosquilla oratoria TaxID=337810 RepID=UPI003F75DB41